MVRAKVSGSQTGAAEITVVSLPRSRLPAARLLYHLSTPTLQGAPQIRARAARVRLRCYSHAFPRGLWNQRPSDGGLSALAEPEPELGGLAARGEGTRRAGAAMGGAAFCPFLSLRRGG